MSAEYDSSCDTWSCVGLTRGYDTGRINSATAPPAKTSGTLGKTRSPTGSPAPTAEDRGSAVGAGLRVGLLVFPEGPEAFAGGAGAELLRPGEEPRVGHRQAGAALWAGSPRRIQAIRHAPRGSDEAASADLQRALHRGAKTAGPARAGPHAPGEGLHGVDLIP